MASPPSQQERELQSRQRQILTHLAELESRLAALTQRVPLPAVSVAAASSPGVRAAAPVSSFSAVVDRHLATSPAASAALALTHARAVRELGERRSWCASALDEERMLPNFNLRPSCPLNKAINTMDPGAVKDVLNARQAELELQSSCVTVLMRQLSTFLALPPAPGNSVGGAHMRVHMVHAVQRGLWGEAARIMSSMLGDFLITHGPLPFPQLALALLSQALLSVSPWDDATLREETESPTMEPLYVQARIIHDETPLAAPTITQGISLKLNSWLTSDTTYLESCGGFRLPERGNDNELTSFVRTKLDWLRRWHRPPLLFVEAYTEHTGDPRLHSVMLQCARTIAFANVCGTLRFIALAVQRMSPGLRLKIDKPALRGAPARPYDLQRVEDTLAEWCQQGLVDRSAEDVLLQRMPHRQLVSPTLPWLRRVATFILQDRRYSQVALAKWAVFSMLQADAPDLDALDLLAPSDAAFSGAASAAPAAAAVAAIAPAAAAAPSSGAARASVPVLFHFADYCRENRVLLELLQLTLPRRSRHLHQWLDAHTSDPTGAVVSTANYLQLFSAQWCGLRCSSLADLDMCVRDHRWRIFFVLYQLGELCNEKNFSVALAPLLSAHRATLKAIRDWLTQLEFGDSLAVLEVYMSDEGLMSGLVRDITALHSFFAQAIAAREAMLPPVSPDCGRNEDWQGIHATYLSLPPAAAVPALAGGLLACDALVGRIEAARKVKVFNSRRYEIAVSLHLLRQLHYRLHLLCRFPLVLPTPEHADSFTDVDRQMVTHNFQGRCMQLLTHDAPFLAEVALLFMAAVGAVETTLKHKAIQVSPELHEAYVEAMEFSRRIRHGDWLRDAQVNSLTACMPMTEWPGKLWRLLTRFYPLLRAAQPSVPENGVGERKRVNLMHPHSLVGRTLTFQDFAAHETQRYKQEHVAVRGCADEYACAVCGACKTFACSRCKVVRYCGQEHQKQDWSQHRKRCASAAAAAAATSAQQ